jgi:hypothetical protein
MLPLIGTLSDYLAVVFEEVADEELVEVCGCRTTLLVYTDCQRLTEDQRICKRVLDRGQTPEDHCQVGVEGGKFSARQVQGLNDGFDVLL